MDYYPRTQSKSIAAPKKKKKKAKKAQSYQAKRILGRSTGY
jgi:hypothetical protein